MPRDTQPPSRRAFLIRIATAAGGATTTTLLPVSLLEASEVCARLGVQVLPDACGDWTLDDQCNAYPPYAFDIRPALRAHAPVMARVADVDRMWVD